MAKKNKKEELLDEELIEDAAEVVEAVEKKVKAEVKQTQHTDRKDD